MPGRFEVSIPTACAGRFPTREAAELWIEQDNARLAFEWGMSPTGWTVNELTDEEMDERRAWDNETARRVAELG